MSDDNIVNFPKSLVDWFKDWTSESGLTQDVIDYGGIRLHSHDPLGAAIFYHDLHGEPTGKIRFRCREGAEQTDEGVGSDYRRRSWSKYLDSKGSKQSLYWTRFANNDHEANISSLAPLYVCEGEKKALRLQMELAKLGLKGSVVGLPGILPGQGLYKEFKKLPYQVDGKKRKVFVLFDFQHPDPDTERETRRAEHKVAAWFVDFGAEVSVLRWEGTGEQKIDDWLQRGGDFYKAYEEGAGNELEERFHKFNEKYAVINGRIVPLYAPNVELSNSQFHVQEAHEIVTVELPRSTKQVPLATKWLEWDKHNILSGRIFVPPPIGDEPKRIINNRLNVSPGWPDVAPWAGGDPSMFDQLLRRQCETEEHFLWLRKHIAHAARFPALGTSNGVVFLSLVQGTGKGMIFRALRKLFGDLIVDVKDEFTGRFNDRLAGKLVALYDEPQHSGESNVNLDISTKRILGNPTLTVEGKGLRPYTVQNYLHIFVAMNLSYLGRISKTDRRWNYFGTEDIMSKEDGARFDAWISSDECAPSLVEWVHSVELTGFNPHALGPASALRVEAIKEAKPDLERFLEYDRLDYKDVWTAEELFYRFQQFAPSIRISQGQFETRIGKFTAKYGEDGKVSVGGKKLRLRAIRSMGKWLGAPPQEWANEFLKEEKE